MSQSHICRFTAAATTVNCQGRKFQSCTTICCHRLATEAENGKVSDYDFYRLFHYLFDDEGNELGWVEPRTEKLDENYKELQQQWLESQGSQLEEGPLKPIPEEENAMFVQAGGGYNRNRAYGLGLSGYKKPSRVGIVIASCSSSSTPTPQIMDDDVHAKLAEMIQKLEESERQCTQDRENIKKLEEIVSNIWRDKEQAKDSDVKL